MKIRELKTMTGKTSVPAWPPVCACSDALESLTRDQRLDGLADLGHSLRALGAPYRFHGELMHGALRDGQDSAITWHLIHVLKKLEQSTRQ